MVRADTMRVVILGNGRMGRAVASVAGRTGLAVTGVLGRTEVEAGTPGATAALAAADVAVEFSTADSVPGNVARCVERGLPVVVGTTGWYERLGEVTALVRRREGAMLWGPNFSVGVALMSRAAGVLARLAVPLIRAGYEARLTEVHHARKRDAPSGTAIRLQEVLRSSGLDVGVTSERVGTVPGTHRLVLEGPSERLVLEHEARTPEVFAEGALRAAAWLRGRRGVFTFEESLEWDRAEAVAE